MHHKHELKTFIINQKIQIIFIMENHFSEKNFLKIRGYDDIKHNIRAHDDTIIIKSSIKYILPICNHDFL